MIKGKFYKEKNMYESFSDTFKAIVNRHTPLKEKIVRGNYAPFMTKELRKTMMRSSKPKIGPLEKTLKTGKKTEKWMLQTLLKLCNKLCEKGPF